MPRHLSVRVGSVPTPLDYTPYQPDPVGVLDTRVVVRTSERVFDDAAGLSDAVIVALSGQGLGLSPLGTSSLGG